MQIQGRRRRGSAKSLRAILRVPGCKSTGVMGKGIERWHPLPPDNNPGCFEALAAFSSVSIQLDEDFWNKVFKQFLIRRDREIFAFWRGNGERINDGEEFILSGEEISYVE